jgi:hypothetical protein
MYFIQPTHFLSRLLGAKRFGVLRLVGWILKVWAWITLVGSILAAIFAGIAAGGSLQLLGNQVPEALAPLLTSTSGGIMVGGGVLLSGIILFLMWYAFGDSIHTQLAVEENTRLTAALLLRMHQESQQDNRGYGSSGFESERFER